jgi:DNA mismatch repair protein MutS
VATIVLMAQVGSFVPARAARIGLVDRISCRVGAEDDLARGLSTFMLEMVETAYILRQSTARSLVILDEVGRGTSTHDGLAIARAVIEHLHDAIGARTLFATHYHELAILERSLDHLRAFQMEVVERDGEAIFLHRVVPGASTQSYGVQVARMAGLPPSVTERAAAMLSESIPMPGNSNIIADDRDGRRVAERPQAYRADEDRDANEPDNAVVATAQPQDEEQLHATREVALALASLNIAAMTPLEAINVIFSLQQQALAALHMQRP